MMNGEDGEVKVLIKSVKVGEITRRFDKYEESINRLGDLFGYKHIQAEVHTVEFLERVISEIIELRDRIAELESQAPKVVVPVHTKRLQHSHLVSVWDCYCGEEVNSYEKFCSRCGAKLNWETK